MGSLANAHMAPTWEQPAKHAAAITPNDSTDLTNFPRALVIGTGGTLKVTTVGGETVTLTVVSSILPLMVERVFATGTTATDITGLW